MKIGYPCINQRIGCSSGRTFRLRSYSEKRHIETVAGNLDCLLSVLQFNVEHGLLFFRITSDLVPFASHPICSYPWHDVFADRFREIGAFIGEHRIRISMHPDQFVVLNAGDPGVVVNSIRELRYHADLLDLMHLDRSAKIQIHTGGVYGDKEQSMHRFAGRYDDLELPIRRRLVVENDDMRYTVQDCLQLHEDTGIPVLFDAFHHELNGSGEPAGETAALCSGTWRPDDGIPMIDYSSRQPLDRRGRHAETLDRGHFRKFLAETMPLDFDLMLEIKDKEKSALLAAEIAAGDRRLYQA
ncbi:MAG: UV DNA damage repair endonuclease UvsE [Methanomicrobiaceae archaeon]|uniref:Uv dna damage endonuclease (Uv-endonuclease) (Uved) n=1 Tax=hydrocarbon metagenome TaxID=938273 RepID=A0A0W8FEQ6_9ZZZZ|nr:UV DNA damage repair endonuclease UvsE [Methanomicrobiaceae archaeon]MDD5418530.1 UV DNA damage repair endonuclease UvsE [Methanomicrobiaceae archaeon]